MAQHDYNIANQTGLEFRADLNDLAEAIVTQNSGPTEPTITYAGMKWLDTSTSPPIEKRRNAANSAWETTLTEAGRAVAGAADAAAQRTALGAQATLVSGTNIKTINGESVLGSGNVAISAGLPAASTAEAQAGTSNTVAITPLRLKEAQIRLGTAANSTSGTVVEFLNIPSWAKRITVMFNGVSTNGASIPQVQIGTSSGFETSGYLGTSAFSGGSASWSSGAHIKQSTDPASTVHGCLVLNLLSGNTWSITGVTAHSNNATLFQTAGTKALSGVLDRLRVTTVNGTDAFDAGQINISWE